MLHFDDRWVWDFWFAQDGADYHMFYLQAPRSLIEERLRHWNVTIGHAVSQDLVNWTVLPDAIHPSYGDESAPDNYTTWTGSIIKYEGLWYMFYTGTSHADKGLIQRVCLATSTDLMTWQKHPNNPLISADPEFYEMLDLTAWHDHAWRDPFVFYLEEDQQFHAYITAREKFNTVDARGVIAHATSKDLIHWTVQKPITKSGEFGHLEVPQLVHINNKYYLLFCLGKREFSHARRERLPDKVVSGTGYLVSDHPLGEFEYQDDFLYGDDFGILYSGKLIKNPQNEWVFMSFLSYTPDGGFVGDIADPLPLEILPNGQLRVSYKAY
jgi:beta-fructofuranosidase